MQESFEYVNVQSNLDFPKGYGFLQISNGFVPLQEIGDLTMDGDRKRRFNPKHRLPFYCDDVELQYQDTHHIVAHTIYSITIHSTLFPGVAHEVAEAEFTRETCSSTSFCALRLAIRSHSRSKRPWHVRHKNVYCSSFTLKPR